MEEWCNAFKKHIFPDFIFENLSWKFNMNLFITVIIKF